jgi:hypothetical protein
MFVVKGGTVTVLLEANATTGPIEQEPLAFETLRAGSRFTLQRFSEGCARLMRPYLLLGLVLIAVYVISVAGYLAFVVYGYQVAEDRLVVIGWTFIAALAAAVLVGWITLINLFYLLMQIAIAAEGVGLVEGARAVVRFIRAEFRELALVFLVVFALVAAAMLVSALAWSGVGLIAFVPLVGLAVFPLQIAALLLRGLVFEYLGLTALGAYVTLYQGHVTRRTEAARRSPVRSPLQHPA